MATQADLTPSETNHPALSGALPEAEITALHALQAKGDYAAAAAGANRLLAAHPANRELLLIEAHSLRMIQQTDAALAVLERFAAHHPNYSQMFLERGLCHVARRDAPAAISDLHTAVAINPALVMGWRMLDGLYRMTGDQRSAELAGRHVAHLASIPPPIVHAKVLFSDGEIDAAEALIRQVLVQTGDHPEAMRLLAQIGHMRNVLDDAEALYEGVLALVPDHDEARHEYVQVLIARHKFPQAREALEPLLRRDPRAHAHRIQAATIKVGLGDFASVIPEYRAMIAEITGNAPEMRIRRADLNLWLGHALKTEARTAEAIDAYLAATADRPNFGDAWWSLANLKTYRFSAGSIAVMQAQLDAATTAEVDRIHIAFALGKALEDAGDYEASWAAYARGNAMHRASNGYIPEVFETNTREQKRVCAPAFFAAREGWGLDDPSPVFVLGLPRSGSTLIEQILASHSMVEGTQELPDIQRIVHELQGRELNFDQPLYPGSLQDLDAEAVRAFGAQYIADTMPNRMLGRPYFIDKMPNNFRHVGLIHLILPNAKIIDARREPMACCFSNLKQLFAQGQEFTYGIEDIARYYKTYVELMDHWDAVLPGRVLRVQHEDVVDDLEGSVRRILDYCGLPFEDACIEFHKTKRSVRTPSSEQVRQPIFRDGLDQWKKFEPWLAPLREALGPQLAPQ
ncbi:tetratricopeptide repeat-containing sulfotransferase family protein [Novosphingobium sp. PASSN1]|uniref:tetratricopeptide repeat-containing sulfotransferase family protein n=1 Tax=Novosphingobium sp. PASSN1 TaxID=2015561 RepID=UPI000BDD3A64|nr:tetratricopeptide repeat-containing sulfotransferase family protein [Novosphingobium sp. PASSN1]OYU37077.1 MAG: sulfotransferase family protein [Novosphingobium sp. PASSN1]